jgi:hypothetical protein
VLGLVCDVKKNLSAGIKKFKPIMLVNTVGPFQGSNYDIVKMCLSNKVHYIDLADGRDFVANISQFNNEAKKSGIGIISGASTVPTLSSAVLEKYKNNFAKLDSLHYSISPGQKAERGLATTKAILSYVGKQLKPVLNSQVKRYGWQDIYCQLYPQIGRRWMSNCDIPDLDIFPKLYKIKNIRFSAGLELGVLHIGLWLLSLIVRIGVPVDLSKYSSLLLKMSNYLDLFGTSDGGMHMIMQGQDQHGDHKTIKWFIIAKNGDGPEIPTIPAVILVKKLFNGSFNYKGAMPCVGMIKLSEYLAELACYNIKTYCSETTNSLLSKDY